MTLLPGTKLGRYEIRSKIGEGGMGEVYLAEDTQLRRKVALKILPAEIAANQDRMRRFVQEAQSAAALNHPNIAHIYEIGSSPTVTEGSDSSSTTEDETHFIAMEYVEGETLREKIHREKVPLQRLLNYLAQVAEGLAKAHAAGIVHRDLKPDNIMITRDGYAKILDFGLAKLIEPTERPQGLSSELSTVMLQQHSTPGMILGTAGYMSPEQAQGKVNEIDHRSDIFSFGCILFETATGRKAFEGKDQLDSLHKIVHTPAPQISELNPAAPAELQRIVRRCLAKDPDKRYQSIKDVAIELEELHHELKSESELEYSVPPPATSNASAIASGVLSGVDSSNRSAAGTTTVEATRSSSSAEYLTNEIKRHKKGIAVVLAVLLIAAIGLAFALYKFLPRKKQFNLQAGKITQLTNNGKVGNATISPDGKYVAYTELDEQGQSSLWVRYLATNSNVQIVPPSGPDVVFGQSTFSPDGNYIYYLRNERGRVGGALYQVPVLGGTSRKVLEGVTRISFSPDGKRFAFERRYSGEGEDAVMVVNADGSGERRLATRKHPDYFLPGPAWSPNGQTIVCPIGGFTGGAYRSLIAIQVSDGTQKSLTSHRWNDVQRVAWLSGGSGVVTTANEQQGAQYQIWRISYPDGEVQAVTNDLSDYRNLSLTADSSALVAVLYDRTSNIWSAPYGEWNSARKLTSSKTNGGFGVAWTPSGKIVYDSRAGGNLDLWIVDADGHNQKQLTDDVHSERAPSVSPDGRHVVFDSARSGTLQIWRIDIDGSNAKQLTSEAGFNPHYSPDGKWVVYTTFGPGGFSIWRIPSEGGEPVPVINKYALIPSVSPDGKLIACYYLDDKTGTSKIALFPIEGGEPVKLFDLPQPAGPSTPPVRWLPDGRALTYVSTRGGVSNIWLQPVDGGQPRQLTDFKTDLIFSFDFSRDGKWLALSRGTEDRDVILINNLR